MVEWFEAFLQMPWWVIVGIIWLVFGAIAVIMHAYHRREDEIELSAVGLAEVAAFDRFEALAYLICFGLGPIGVFLVWCLNRPDED